MTATVFDLRRPGSILLMLLSIAALAALIGLGTWQVQRLQWKQELLATIDARIASEPRSLDAIQAHYANTGDVEYWPVTATGEFRHDGERHFFATHEGRSGYFVYTPLELDNNRFVLVNRGFVPFDRKDPETRPEGQVEGTVTITGLARNPRSEPPSWIVPENQPGKNQFFWKDFETMAATSGVAPADRFLPFFIDADDSPNPGGLPIGGVTIVNLPNNHLQYAITWYGLAVGLCAVVGAWLWQGRKGQ